MSSGDVAVGSWSIVIALISLSLSASAKRSFDFFPTMPSGWIAVSGVVCIEYPVFTACIRPSWGVQRCLCVVEVADGTDWIFLTDMNCSVNMESCLKNRMVKLWLCA